MQFKATLLIRTVLRTFKTITQILSFLCLKSPVVLSALSIRSKHLTMAYKLPMYSSPASLGTTFTLCMFQPQGFCTCYPHQRKSISPSGSHQPLSAAQLSLPLRRLSLSPYLKYPAFSMPVTFFSYNHVLFPSKNNHSRLLSC